jgi:hypothetical protein
MDGEDATGYGQAKKGMGMQVTDEPACGVAGGDESLSSSRAGDEGLSVEIAETAQERTLSVAMGIAVVYRLSKRGQAERGLKSGLGVDGARGVVAGREELRYWSSTQMEPLREQVERMYWYLAQLESRLTSRR